MKLYESIILGAHDVAARDKRLGNNFAASWHFEVEIVTIRCFEIIILGRVTAERCLGEDCALLTDSLGPITGDTVVASHARNLVFVFATDKSLMSPLLKTS